MKKNVCENPPFVQQESPEYTGFMPESTSKQVLIMILWAMYFFAAGFAVSKYLPAILRWLGVLL